MTKKNYIEYNNVEKLKALLIGRKIVSRTQEEMIDKWKTQLTSIKFTLDNGVILEARETDGGCSCSNGCWSVQCELETLPDSVITDVSVVDELDKYSVQGDGSATLRMFVYCGDNRFNIVTSRGGDNGYYGWGYAIYVHSVSEPDEK